MITRFDYVGGSYPMKDKVDGEYVEYDDYAALEAKASELNEELESLRDKASGMEEYLAYLEAAVSEAGFEIKHDGGTLGDSNFRLEPKGGSTDAPKYTTGHCDNRKKPGGCQLHNLQCGYPKCDRK